MAADARSSWAGHDVGADRRTRLVAGVAAPAVATSFGVSAAVPLPWTLVPGALQPLFVIPAGGATEALAASLPAGPAGGSSLGR